VAAVQAVLRTGPVTRTLDAARARFELFFLLSYSPVLTRRVMWKNGKTTTSAKPPHAAKTALRPGYGQVVLGSYAAGELHGGTPSTCACL